MNETTTNLKNKAIWKRIFYMILFVIFYNIAKFVLTAIVIIQLVSKLFTGNVNGRLLGFSNGISRYIYDILLFLTFATEEIPFPFTEWKEK